jgi:hypothetical protein
MTTSVRVFHRFGKRSIPTSAPSTGVTLTRLWANWAITECVRRGGGLLMYSRVNFSSATLAQ